MSEKRPFGSFNFPHLHFIHVGRHLKSNFCFILKWWSRTLIQVHGPVPGSSHLICKGTRTCVGPVSKAGAVVVNTKTWLCFIVGALATSSHPNQSPHASDGPDDRPTISTGDGREVETRLWGLVLCINVYYWDATGPGVSQQLQPCGTAGPKSPGSICSHPGLRPRQGSPGGRPRRAERLTSSPDISAG